MSRRLDSIRVVHIGNVAKGTDGDIYCLKNYASFYNELAGSAKEVTVYAGYIREGDMGFDFLFERPLAEEIRFDIARGNTPATGTWPFLVNNFRLLWKLVLFSGAKEHYFIFLPSPLGIWSALLILFFRRKKSLGIYIGGYYGLEQKNESRKQGVKRALKKFIAERIDRLVVHTIKHADFTITSSYEYFESFRDLGKVFLTPPLINVDETDLAEPGGMNPPAKYITYCGELRHAKGVIDLLMAFISLANVDGLKDYKLKLIGSGQAHKELTDLAIEHKLENRVVFCGQIRENDKLKEAIRSSTLFVLPSYSEGFPRVAYECFTLGVPSILTPVGGIPFLVKDNVHCLFCTPGDVGSIATAIKRLVEDESLRKSLAYNARKLMVESVFPRIRKDRSLASMISDKINLKKERQ